MEHEFVKLILALPWPAHIATAMALFGYGCAIAAASAAIGWQDLSGSKVVARMYCYGGKGCGGSTLRLTAPNSLST